MSKKRETPSTLNESAVIKPGYETSEFWVTIMATIIPNVITLLALMKIVPNEIVDTLSTSIVAVVGGIITIIAAIKYLKSRTDVKVSYLNIKRDMQLARQNNILHLYEKGVVKEERIRKEFDV